MTIWGLLSLRGRTLRVDTLDFAVWRAPPRESCFPTAPFSGHFPQLPFVFGALPVAVGWSAQPGHKLRQEAPQMELQDLNLKVNT